MPQLSHIDDDGRATMVDVGEKAVTKRTAVAAASVHFPRDVYLALAEDGFTGAKGSLTETARLAGIMGAKRTSELIPLCHPLPLSYVGIDIMTNDETYALEIRCEARCTGKTGVEMEALTGASVAALTIYDMAKALSHDITIHEVRLVKKSGGKSDVNRLTPKQDAP